MTNLNITPRVCIQCLAAYNAGALHFEWVDADMGAEHIHERIAALLASSPVEGAEEIHFADTEDLPGIGEYSTPEEAAAVGELVSEHGQLGLCVLREMGDLDSARRALEDGWEVDSFEDYAWDFARDQVGDNDFLMGYLDIEKLARDLKMDYYTIDLPNGGVFIVPS